MVGIQDADSGSIRCWRIAGVGIARAVVRHCRERSPFTRIGKEKTVADLLSSGHAHKMLLRFSRLVALDDIDDVKLPGRVANGISVRDLIHHVVEIVDGVDDFPDVRLLRLGHSRHLKRVGLFPVTIAVRVPVYPADIVVTVVGVIAPDISIRHTLAGIPGSPKIEQHDADIHPSVTGGNHSCSEAVEIGLIKLVQVKLR